MQHSVRCKVMRRISKTNINGSVVTKGGEYTAHYNPHIIIKTFVKKGVYDILGQTPLDIMTNIRSTCNYTRNITSDTCHVTGKCYLV